MKQTTLAASKPVGNRVFLSRAVVTSNTSLKWIQRGAPIDFLDCTEDDDGDENNDNDVHERVNMASTNTSSS